MVKKYLYGSEFGFTLIELMIVIAIIGILAAVAIPQFSSYRIRSYNTAAMNDIRNVANAQEAYFVDNEKYTNSLSDLLSSDYGLNVTSGVAIDVSGNVSAYLVTAYHSSGNKTYTLAGPGGTIKSI